MKLTDNKDINTALGRELEDDGWTVSKLATAQPKDLTGYKGVGYVKARRIIGAAQKATNEKALEETTELDHPGLSIFPDPPLPMASARIMRLRELAKKNG